MYIFFSNNVFEPIKGIEFGKITTKELERFFPRGVNKFRNYREFILKGNYQQGTKLKADYKMGAIELSFDSN